MGLAALFDRASKQAKQTGVEQSDRLDRTEPALHSGTRATCLSGWKLALAISWFLTERALPQTLHAQPRLHAQSPHFRRERFHPLGGQGGEARGFGLQGRARQTVKQDAAQGDAAL